MKKKTVAVITRQESDFLALLKKVSNVSIMPPGSICKETLDQSDAIAILGGTHEEPIVFGIQERVWIEEQIQQGKKVFNEYTKSLGHTYAPEPESTRKVRLVFCGEDDSITELKKGDILEDQCNMALKFHDITCSHNIPILQYIDKIAHDHILDFNEEENLVISDRGLWFDNPQNLLICSFRISNFIRARFSPVDRWKRLVQYLLHWLTEVEINIEDIPSYYHVKPYRAEENLEERVEESIQKAMDWYKNINILIDEGRGGVLEGLATEIYPDGTQRLLTDVRADCTGEVSMAYFMNYLRTKEESYLRTSDQLAKACFDLFQIKDHPYLKGMMRWTNIGWGICYQDDVARAIIPELLKVFYTGTREHLDDCVNALHFLVKTTGTDGTRVFRTDNIDLSPEKIEKLGSTPGNHPSTHYNGFYLAALLLTYKLTGITEFREVGIKGLETIMSVYPNTIREHSETQELCRLILPLSWLYWITKEEKHKGYLYQVVEDLQKYKHSTGAYIEWDSGYQATRNGDNRDEESSLLSENGDPVVDLLYSLNWLPMSFMQAYFVTKDPYFITLWEEISSFMISCQIHSEDKKIHGAWARAFDVEKMEVYGLSKDLGWGPWAIESGWTMGEITAGLTMGLLKEELQKHYLK